MEYKQQLLRGVEIAESANKVQALLDGQHQQWGNNLSLPAPQLSIGGFRLPGYLEDLGIFCVGSPGSGKTQAVAKLIAQIQQRPDFRLVCFDRNGEFTQAFFNEGRDILFNPQDERSIGWNHHSESARYETMATAIIPESFDDPFWSHAARNFLSEVYRRVATNEEVWYANSQASLDTLQYLLGDSVFAKYFEAEKTIVGIIATATTYTGFWGT